MLLPTRRVIVRDFAFNETDPRHTGQGQQSQEQQGSRRRRTKWRTVEGSADGDYFEEVPDDEEDEGRIGFDVTDFDAPDEAVELKGDDPSPSADDDESFHGLFRALYDFQGENSQELSFSVGDWLWISYRHTAGWLVGQRMVSRKRRRGDQDAEPDPDNDDIPIDELEIDTDETGLIPENYVEFVGSYDAEDTSNLTRAGHTSQSSNNPPVPPSPASSTPTERLSTASKTSSRASRTANGDIISLAGQKRQSNGDIVALLQAES